MVGLYYGDMTIIHMKDKKRELRKFIRQRKTQYSAAERQRQSAAICQRVIEMECWKKASCIMAYWALPDEVDVRMLIDKAMADDKQVLLPVVIGDDLALYTYKGELRTGAFGIMEPVPDGEAFTAYSAIDLVIVPGMAFDRDGARLGRGKGYYDRLLCQMPLARRVGVCFDFQLLPSIPAEQHDMTMHEVVSLGRHPAFTAQFLHFNPSN